MTTNFQERVYTAVKHIPKGKVTTYGDLARALGSAPRAIGQALRCNPYAPTVPCHRVVASNGRIGGFGGHITGPRIEEKMGLLANEGVQIQDGTVKDFTTIRHTFNLF